jgi:ribosomal-protein-alanine N-acetyltransferase
MIQTQRLRLVPFEAQHLEAFFRDRREMGNLLEASVPRSFPVFPEQLYNDRELLRDDPDLSGWLHWFIIHRYQGIVIGNGGFKGRPDSEGVVEIAYAIIPEYREQGYATEAARALADWAFSHPEVTALTAETLVHAREPARVLERLGMKQVETARQSLRWRVTREEYANAALRKV